MDSIREKVSKFFDCLAIIVAILVICVYVFEIVNNKWSFITDANILNIMNYVKIFGAMLAVGLIAIKFAILHDVLLQIIIYVCILAVVIYNFFPEVWKSFGL